MAEKKKPIEDSRDIFEKALDNAPLIMAVGGALGLRRLMKRNRKLPETVTDNRITERTNRALAVPVGGVGGYVAGDMVARDRAARRKRQ